MKLLRLGLLVMGGWAVAPAAWANPLETSDESFPQSEPIPAEQTSIERSPATTVKDWMAQIEAAQVQITGVRLEEAETGLQVILETAAGTLATPATTVAGNVLMADIPNAVLALPEGEAFEAVNPVVGIERVRVISVPGDQVRVTVSGADAPPVAEVQLTETGLVFAVTPGTGEVAESEDEEVEITVTATRREEPLNDIPRSVTVITREQIEAQTTLNRRNLEDILARSIPGASAPSGRTLGTFNLRGQEVSILIDGIPQDTNSNNTFSAPLAGLDPSSIERIEVIRGPNAIYGGQAIGGVVNIITRKPNEDKITATTELGFKTALTDLTDAQGFTIGQQVSGTTGKFDYTAGLTFDSIGQAYDAEGDRIGDGFNFDNTHNFNGLLNLGFNPSERERLQLRFNYFQSSRDTDFIQDVSTDSIPGIQKARLTRRPEGTQIIGAISQLPLVKTGPRGCEKRQNLV